MTRRLLLCAGHVRWDGWETLDGDPAHGPDHVAHIPPLPPPVAQTAWDEIALIHGIEHFFPQDAATLLREIHAVLVPGGRLVLEQPDIKFCMEVALGLRPRPREEFEEQCGLAGIFGDPRYGNYLMTHHWGYWPESLTALLVRCGFEPAKIKVLPAQFHRPDRDFRVEAVK